MKITPTTNANKPEWENEKTTTRRGEPPASIEPDGGESASALKGAEERDFSRVLEDVSRPAARHGEEIEAEGEGPEARRTDRAEREAVERREERRGEDDGKGGGSGGGGFDHSRGIREIVSPSDSPDARAILHITDLERIVSAVRTQVLASGRHETTIELRRSVLEGLRVKVSAGADGKVSAEFIASSERVRAQLDARTAELAELLRSRGINLEALRTSVGADASHQDYSSGGERRPSELTGSLSHVAHRPPAPSDTEASGMTTNESADTDTTYRA